MNRNAKSLYQVLLIPLSLLAVILHAAAGQGGPSAGPFGFQRGMTVKQVVDLVGKDSVKEASGDTLTLENAPKPHPAFKLYRLTFSPTEGLVRIFVVGKDIQANENGDELRKAFAEITTAVSNTYGISATTDFPKSGSTSGETRYWMLELLKNHRMLASMWKPKPVPPNGVTGILLEALALSQEKGYLRLVYELTGFEQYLDDKKAKQDSVF